ncbi:MAG: PAS domain-containing protein, partial [Anaerolineae bacterium]|nr:PAS domain-containing protein [Anaerolineae bacterium]
MNGPLLAVTLPLIASALVAGGLAIYTWHRRIVLGARIFALFMVSVMAWSLVSAATHLSPTLSGKLFWTNSQYIWVGLVPALWLLFVFLYTGRERLLTVRTIALLSIHPIVLQPVVWLNPGKLFRMHVWLDAVGEIPTLGNQLGPLFWVHAVYSYGVLIAGSVLLWRAHFGTPRIYLRQGVSLAIAIVVPWLANIVTIVGAPALSHLDLTPFAFTISGAAIALGLFRHGFLDLVPVARSAVVRSLATGVVVLDAQSRIVDLNPAAEAVLDVTREEVSGQPLGTVLPQCAYVMSRHEDLQDARDEIVVGQGENRRVYDLRFSALQDLHGKVIGHLLTLQDITERKESQTALSRYAERLRILHQIDEAILNARSPEEIAVAALGQIHHLFPAQCLSVLALDGTGPTRPLAIRASGRLRRTSTVWEEAADADSSVFSQVTCINDVAGDESADWMSRRLYDEGVRAYLVAPLIVQKELIGALALESTIAGAFGSEHIDVASQVATSLAVGLESARRYIAAQQELAERKIAEEALRQSEVTLRQKAEDLAARN